MFKEIAFLFFILLSSGKLSSQIASDYVLIFDFNNHIIQEKNNKINVKPVGVTLTTDRFGNENSAIYTHGHVSSYLNLGTEKVLKPENGTVSLWVKIERRVYSCKGADFNPLLYTKNSEGVDFIDAIAIIYSTESNRFNIGQTCDSLKEVLIYSKENVQFNSWYHLVLTFDSLNSAFYVNGELQGRFHKGFKTKYLDTDSIVVGHSASKKNERYTLGAFDDIKIFHRVLSEKEILELYNEPNPNKIKKILNESLKYLIVILVLVIIIVVLIIRNKKALKQQKEKSDVQNKISELELKVVKAQMNPHFISNCLAAIQELIYSSQVEKAGQYIAKFSFFLRQVLNFSDKNYISLSEELDLIKLNIELEQLRFKNEFEFQINIESEIDTHDVRIPALLTQPFIENAIWHGLLPLGNNRRPILKINIYQAAKFPVIEIEDNGIGRNIESFNKEKSKGTKLAFDKIENLNRLSGNANFKIQIIDLFDERKQPCGTKIIIQLNDAKL